MVGLPDIMKVCARGSADQQVLAIEEPAGEEAAIIEVARLGLTITS